jgi:hypothetical protein
MTHELFPTIHIEGSILPADLLAKIAANDPQLEGLLPADYGLSGEKINEAINHAWNRLSAAWDHFQSLRSRLPSNESPYKFTLDKWLLPFWQILGYGRLEPARPVILDQKLYPISHFHYHSPFHLVGFSQDLDKKLPLESTLPSGVTASRNSPHGLVQEFLNRSEAHLWGFVSNGFKLRILRDNIRLTRQAYVEFDLQALFDGKQYTDFALLWKLCHESRLRAEKPEQCWLERWSKLSIEQGLRALDQLRSGVENAIKALGRGFLSAPANEALRDCLRDQSLSPQDYYRELLRLVYRLLFLLVAEDRDLLFLPNASDLVKDRYRQFFSMARLRRMAERLRGTSHTDLYQALSLVLNGLGEQGIPALGLPALGGLFHPNKTPHLQSCHLANSDLLDALRALCFTHDGHSLRAVDYRNLGAEELGSVYESLLELKPTFDRDSGDFQLLSLSGNERKTTGSYYTPKSLITCLLDSALEPVLNEAASRPDPEAALLALKVCDPACGSGHFLIAAAHRIAKKLASVRTLEEEPAPDAIRHALRDVITRCIYGVDINSMAVELCQVALWMESLEPGKPLSFLDHHIQCGNSLLGATPALLKAGIPDNAFERIEGDDTAVCKTLKKQNKDERRGQGELFSDYLPWQHLGNLPEAMAKLELGADDTVESVREKELHYAALQSEAFYRSSGRFLADAWCAAFVWKKNKQTQLLPMTESRFRRIEKNPHDIGPREFAEVRRLAQQYQFFHWHLVFPSVFRYPTEGQAPDNPLTGWCGGFDVVLGNPPWERVKLQEKEWFTAHGRPDIAKERTNIRQQKIRELQTTDPALFQAFTEDRRKAEGESHFIRNSSDINDTTGARHGMFPLCGRGDVNTYSLFAELNRNLIRPTGRVGCIVPSGIATDDTTRIFFQDVAETGSLVSLFDFENRLALFPDVDSRMKFALLTMSGQERPIDSATFVFFAHQVEDLLDPEKRFTLSPADFVLLNPNTRTCPVFRNVRDAELTKAIYRRVPILLRENSDHGNPWGISFMAMFHMSNDSESFRTAEDLNAEGYTFEGNIFRKGKAEYLPLYEAKMLHQFDHRWATYQGTKSREVTLEEKQNPNFVVQPRYWVSAAEVSDRLKDRWDRPWLLGWRNITNSTNMRTTIVGILPRVGVGHSSPLMMFKNKRSEIVYIFASLCSLVFDYVSRNKMGGINLTYGILNQLPVLPPKTYEEPCPWEKAQTLAEWIRPRVLELTYTAYDLKPFAEDLGYRGEPFIWNEERRMLLRAELDAAFFHLYGVSEADVDYIMETFPIVQQNELERYGSYRTKELILEIYREMATGKMVSKLNPPAGKRNSG